MGYLRLQTSIEEGTVPMTGIIEKIQKLPALADRAGTEAEAALAAQRVAELCQQHNLDIGVATLIKEEKDASEAIYTIPASRFLAHQGDLAGACNALFNVGSCVRRGSFWLDSQGRLHHDGRPETKLVFYGLKANVHAALETYHYLEASVESLLHGYIREGHPLKGRTDFRGFRMGASWQIHLEAKKARNVAAEHFQASDESQALVRLELSLVEAYTKLLVRGRGSRHELPGNKDHYEAGYSAGAKVDLHGAQSSGLLR